ncbi:uncharacterized protein LOC127848771 [Dreissena polymorpha]|uniref:Uncharacterized protein n=1 Tax=Dreissena polymorpha TaxID=45954 RepID=A0A9D4DPY3_DREPO|nr:uncharacterized protein LOC127848771 [Dreissena polymorpha]XP_052237334.1 uncharacterized protein LOC127848771 [Dreissena polymorpha]XP_052237335.1 uncharacterized protein LOC127848771 [Dreissena polymorpha]XP_052237336.1 uncharacterized protein LOC127848771 [Dreissena polymorpha]KAH3752002.1 hypothetical protein DPMN_186610 [Dreissena polymorpha]
MSGNYYKKVKTPPPPNAYGFRQVNSKELQEILKRVTKATYSAKLHTEEQRQVNNYELLLSDGGRRSVASACGRRTASRISSTDTADGTVDSRSRRFTEREMLRHIRRLQRPTTATSLHSRGYTDSDEAQNLKEGKLVRARSADVSSHIAKSLVKLRRPTTATLAKTVHACHLCYDHENKKESDEPDAFDFDYCDEKVVLEEELDFIVERVSAPTFASNKSNISCQRSPGYIDEVKIRENLPLLSGLRRSKTVKEITNRLFPSRRHHGFAPQATTVVSY